MIKPPPVFQSFFMGGFEAATHRNRERKQIDVIAQTAHDTHCAEDYRLLARAGLRTVRDSLRWHLIERAPNVYDWSSFLPQLEAAIETRTQVIWDLCHWGIPPHLDIFQPDFVESFAAFSSAAASLIRARSVKAGIHTPAFYCPINEISFWAWSGGDVEYLYPYQSNRGPELKQQLVLASIGAIQAIRQVDPDARFFQADPIIHISADSKKPEDAAGAARYTDSQYEAWDLIAGRGTPPLGGSEDLLDIIGVNYYWNNQWIHEGDHTPPGHALHRPLHSMLLEVWQRYRRAIVITETGVEGDAAIGWFGYICSEVREAQRQGALILGICLYPVMDYPGWDDDRHCSCGLLALGPGFTTRSLREHFAAELQSQSRALLEPD